MCKVGYAGGSVSKDAGDLGLTPGWGSSPGEGNVYPLQYSCLKNLMDRGGWWPTVHESQRVKHDQVTKHTDTHVQGSM